MDYKVKFSDGSDAYLAHHGVKGMKWGVRNAETMAKYAGGTNRQIRKAAAAQYRSDIRKARADRAAAKENGTGLVKRNLAYLGATQRAEYKRDVKAYGGDKKNARGQKYTMDEYIIDRYSSRLTPYATRTKSKIIAKGGSKGKASAAAFGKDLAIGSALVTAVALTSPAGRKLVKTGAATAQLYMKHTVNQAKVAKRNSRTVRYAARAGMGRARNRARGVRYVSGMGLGA